MSITLILIVSNYFCDTYEDLNETDKIILSELANFYQKNKIQSIWSNYNFDDKTIVALNGTLGNTYIINPKKEIKSLFITKIDMPEDKKIEVYRTSILDLQFLKIRMDFGNFNTIGKKCNVHGNEIYYTKYNLKESIEQRNTSRHYITFLTHEAFHYYMQENWPDGDGFTGNLTSEDIELISSEYDILSKIQVQLKKKVQSRKILIEYAKAYIDIVEKRIALNPKYLKNELSVETIEGTANYVSIKASDMVNYDYGILYFDNTNNVKFSDIIPELKSGKINNSFLFNRMPYETGALLCEIADALKIND